MELKVLSFNQTEPIQQAIRKCMDKLLQKSRANGPKFDLPLVNTGEQTLFTTTQPAVSLFSFLRIHPTMPQAVADLSK